MLLPYSCPAYGKIAVSIRRTQDTQGRVRTGLVDRSLSILPHSHPSRPCARVRTTVVAFIVHVRSQTKNPSRVVVEATPGTPLNLQVVPIVKQSGKLPTAAVVVLCGGDRDPRSPPPVPLVIVLKPGGTYRFGASANE